MMVTIRVRVRFRVTFCGGTDMVMVRVTAMGGGRVRVYGQWWVGAILMVMIRSKWPPEATI